MANEVNGFKWVDGSGLPRATNGAWDAENQTVKPDAPTLPAQPATPKIDPSDQARRDYYAAKDGADPVSLRSKFAHIANLLELQMYDLTLSQIRHPHVTRSEARRNWNRQPARRLARKAA